MEFELPQGVLGGFPATAENRRQYDTDTRPLARNWWRSNAQEAEEGCLDMVIMLFGCRTNVSQLRSGAANVSRRAPMPQLSRASSSGTSRLVVHYSVAESRRPTARSSWSALLIVALLSPWLCRFC